MGEVVIVGAFIHDDANRVFLMKSPKWEGYGIPGGKPKTDESEEIALRREVREELGIEISDLVKAEEIRLSPTKKIDGKTAFTVKPYFAYALTTDITPNAEVGEHGWYTLDEALKLDLLEPIRKTVKTYSRITTE